MDYDIRYNSAAVKYFKKIKDQKLKSLYLNTINKLQSDPYIGEQKKGDLAGIYSIDIYYNRTNYELAYRIYEKENKTVVVILAGTRENFYEQLRRYL